MVDLSANRALRVFRFSLFMQRLCSRSSSVIKALALRYDGASYLPVSRYSARTVGGDWRVP